MATRPPKKFPVINDATRDMLTQLAMVDGAIRNAPLRRADKENLLIASQAARASIRNNDLVDASIKLNELSLKSNSSRLPETTKGSIQRSLNRMRIQTPASIQSLQTRQVAWTVLPNGLISDRELASAQRVTAPMIPVVIDAGSAVTSDTPVAVIDAFRSTLTDTGVSAIPGTVGATGATGPSGPSGPPGTPYPQQPGE